MPENYEGMIMGLITHDGSCNSLAFAALQAAKRQDHDQVQRLLAGAKKVHQNRAEGRS
ncbi:PTS lactose/cellobiose transporter subunit IIA [Leclercia sp. M50]|uniref:PTS lactose/cellobiose transporter subunit IIA n=1 Tax=Leclercia sp. M50 TaxID=3081258 RepID=UPI00301660F4